MALTIRDRRALIVFGAIVVLAAGAYFLMLKPSKGAGSPRAGHPVVSPNGQSPKPKASGHKPRHTPPPGNPVVQKNPFSPLVSPSGGGGPTSTSTGTPPPTTVPATTPAPTVSPPASPSNAPPGASAVVAGHTVVLI